MIAVRELVQTALRYRPTYAIHKPQEITMFRAILRVFVLLFIASFICLTVVVKHPVAAQANQPFSVSIAPKRLLPSLERASSAS